MMKCKHALTMLFLAGALPGAFRASGNDASLQNHYRLDVTLDVESRRISGTNTFVVHHPYARGMEPLLVFAYPNHYSVFSPQITHERYDRVFPESISLGSMTFHDILFNRKKGIISPQHPATLPDRVVFSASPPQHQQLAQEQIAVSISYAVEIPERFGAFGAYKSALCLNGGWYPYLPARQDHEWSMYAPPPKSDFDLRLNVKQAGHIFINGQHYAVVENATIHAHIAARYLTLLFMPQAYVYQKKVENTKLTYVSKGARETAATLLLDAASLAIEHLLTKTDLQLPADILFTEAPLRRDLAIAAEGMVLVSDRILEVFRPLREYHIGPLVEALYTVLLQDTLPMHDPDGFNWEAEAVAWVQAQRFWQEYRKRARTMATYLRPFGFIPSIDAIIHAPRFPFVGAFFGDFYDTDPIREDILRFNRRTSHGRILAEKLRDLLQTDGLTIISDQALNHKTPFQQLAQQQHGSAIEDYLQQWGHPYPDVNYRLSGWEQMRQADGRYVSVVRIRQTGAPLEEPVVVELKRRFGATYRGRWTGAGNTGIVSIKTARRTHRVRLDPDRRLRETTRKDNRYPPSARLLLNSIRLRIDLNNRDHEIRAGGSVIFRNDYRHRYRFDFFSEQERRGIRLLHVQAFGSAFSIMDFRHNIMYGFVQADLDPAFASTASGFTNHTGTVSEISVRYEMRTTDSGRNPLDGTLFYMGAELGHKELGGNFRYWKSSTGANVVLPLKRDRHLLAMRARIGASDKHKTPTQMLYDIGGFDGVRGINRGRILGHHELVGSAEYRYIFWKEMRSRGLALIWTRMLQAAFYVDAANVADTLDGLRQGAPYWGIGLGLRFYTDILGVFPTVVRLDVARQMDRPRIDDRPMYHIGLGHSF